MNKLGQKAFRLPAATAEEDVAATSLARVLKRIYNPHIGLIRFLAEVGTQPDEPPLFLAVAEHQNPFLVPPRSLDTPPAEAPKVSVMGTGSALDRISALWSTVGEATERYALHIYDRDQIVVASEADLTQPFLSPSRMIMFSDAQYAREDFQFRRYDPAAPIGWARGIDLASGETAYVPACMSYLGYRPISPAECLDSGYSTGGAAGPTLEAALHSGLLEVIERDGFACHWYLRRTPPEIRIDDYVEQLPANLVEVFRSAKLKLRLFDITTDLGIPTVLAVGLPANGGIAIGASARPTFAVAIEKAVLEAFHTFNWISDLRRSGARIEDYRDVRAYRDHVVWHLDPSRHGCFDFILKPAGRPERLPVAALGGAGDAGKLLELTMHLSGRGYGAYGLDLTPLEVEGLDLHVARGFVPGLHPLGAGSGNEHLDDRRLRTFARSVGLPFPKDLNLDLHPFP